MEKIIFGGGCFWCTEAVFTQLKGVLSVMPGYSGGMLADPSYEQVSDGNTGHVEVVQIEYDSRILHLEDLLTVFFATHNPTTPDRQGHDIGSQYRSVIFYSTENQKKVITSFITELQNDFAEPIVTDVKQLNHFYPAEDYHRSYYDKNQEAPYCQLVINPKLEKLHKKFQSLLKP